MAKSNAADPVAHDETPESLDQVRDILFGAQMRTVERRLAQAESRLLREIEDFRKEVAKQLKSQEKWATKRTDSLDAKIGTERAKRTEDLKSLRQDLRKGLKSLGSDLSKLDDATSQVDADLRDQLLQFIESLSSQIAALSDKVTEDLGRAVSDVRSEDSRNMASVADIFSGIADRLGKDGSKG
jgi:uncharacterized phage infection (PIP) family protein YhgE